MPGDSLGQGLSPWPTPATGLLPPICARLCKSVSSVCSWPGEARPGDSPTDPCPPRSGEAQSLVCKVLQEAFDGGQGHSGPLKSKVLTCSEVCSLTGCDGRNAGWAHPAPTPAPLGLIPHSRWFFRGLSLSGPQPRAPLQFPGTLSERKRPFQGPVRLGGTSWRGKDVVTR